MDVIGFKTRDGGVHYYDYRALTNRPSSEDSAAAPELDTTLTQSGKAADAKAVGDALTQLGGAAAAVVDYDRYVRGINHRGFHTVAPENTIPAFILSRKNGFTYVGCDISFTSDGVCVLLHDSTVDRTSNGSGKISSMTYAQAKQYDYGSWKSEDYAGIRIPGLNEFLLVCRGLGLHPYLAIKNETGITQEMVNTVVTAVQTSGMKGKVTYLSGNAGYLEYVKVLDPDARLGYVVEGITSTEITVAKAMKLDTNQVFLSADHSELTDAMVDLCIRADLPLEVWNCNSESWIENMNPYISGVTSDSVLAGRVLYNKYMHYEQKETAVLTGISVTYSGGSVAAGTALSALRGIGVTASYSDGSRSAVTGYSLSGAVGEGENTVTVSYGGKTAFFQVTGVAGNSGDESAPEAPAVPVGYALVRNLYSDDLQYRMGSQYQYPTSDPPYTIQNTMRVGYLHQDIPVEYGYSYRVEFVSRYETAQYSMQLITQAGLDLMASGAQFSSGGTPNTQVYDSGWLANGAEVLIPEHHNNSPCVRMRLAFRMSTQNQAVVSGDIQNVTISRKPV